MKRIDIKKNGVITNSWTDDKLPLDHKEPGFGAEGTYERIVVDITLEVAAAKAKEQTRKQRVEVTLKTLVDRAKANTDWKAADANEAVRLMLLDKYSND